MEAKINLTQHSAGFAFNPRRGGRTSAGAGGGRGGDGGAVLKCFCHRTVPRWFVDQRIFFLCGRWWNDKDGQRKGIVKSGVVKQICWQRATSSGNRYHHVRRRLKVMTDRTCSQCGGIGTHGRLCRRLHGRIVDQSRRLHLFSVKRKKTKVNAEFWIKKTTISQIIKDVENVSKSEVSPSDKNAEVTKIGRKRCPIVSIGSTDRVGQKRKQTWASFD